MTAPLQESLPCDGGPVEIFRTGTGGTGPRVAVIGGIHGDEIEGVLAARLLLGMLSQSVVRGQITVVPVANPPAFRLSSRCGPDGLNLARVFPGRAAGSVTEQLARLLTEHVITGSTTSRRGTVTWTAGSPSVRPVCLFVAHVRAGAETAAGDTLGEVVTPDGAHAEWIRSPGQGRVMMIR